MAVHIRLTRMGSKKKPFYRIVVIDSRVKRDGEYLELIGVYDVLNNKTKINKEIAMKWLNEGAIPSNTVRNIFSKHGVMKEFSEMSDKKKSELVKKNLNKKKTLNKKKSSKKVVSKKPIASKNIKVSSKKKIVAKT